MRLPRVYIVELQHVLNYGVRTRHRTNNSGVWKQDSNAPGSSRAGCRESRQWATYTVSKLLWSEFPRIKVFKASDLSCLAQRHQTEVGFNWSIKSGSLKRSSKQRRKGDAAHHKSTRMIIAMMPSVFMPSHMQHPLCTGKQVTSSHSASIQEFPASMQSI